MDTVITEEHIVVETIEFEYKKHGGSEKVPAPRDKYFFCHIVFFMWGMVHLMPMTFFNAANNYWLYKFRNLSDPTMAAENRTTLGTHFASSTMIVNTIPALLLGMWNIAYGHKFKIMNRLILTLVIEVAIFCIFTVFVKINTDSYQTGFFTFVLVMYGILSGAATICTVASTLLYPRFPVGYMKTCMIGEGVSGIIGDVLNIITVAIFDDVRDSTLMYFIFGSCVIALTLTLTVIVSRTEYFKHSLSTMPEDHTKEMTPRKEIFRILNKIKITLIITFSMIISMASTHTSITSLVVSEQSTATSTWASKFFTPVLTFLWTDVCMLIGRLLSTHSPLQFLPDMSLYVLAIARTGILVPFIWFCNAQPRSHVSVLFPHDYQYAIIMGTFMILNGFLTNMAWLVMPRRTTRHESEIAYNVFSLILGVLTTLSSPIGMFIVHIL